MQSLTSPRQLFPKMNTHPITLTIVIPALNEEQAIRSTVERCLAARQQICREGGVQQVSVLVVSDGSTDSTAQIARSCGVEVIEFPINQGYGAAIKAGWAHGGGGLLGFLDADGTCDPVYFGRMCREILEGSQDVVLGCRMGADSQMPLVRRIGNTLFAALLGFLSRKRVRDTASGMRVVKREALAKLLPLPDGLHFTPAMSARALMDDELRIYEIPMEYSERIGRSKLHVLVDGVRFLHVILAAAAYIRVSALTGPLIAVIVVAVVALIAGPAAYYLENRALQEWMFYRCALAGMLAAIAVTLLSATIVAEHLSALALLRYGRFGARSKGLWRYENLRTVVGITLIFWVGLVVMHIEGVRELLSSGTVSLHWSRVMAGAFMTIILADLLAALAIIKIMRALNLRQPFLHQFSGSSEAAAVLGTQPSLSVDAGR